MTFYSAVIQPLAAPGLALTLLLGAGWRHRPTGAGLPLALGLLLPIFLLAQALLSIADWCVQPLSAAGPVPPGLPWYTELLLAPVCYLYLRVLSGTELRPARAWRQLLPGLGQVGLFAGVAILGLGARQGLLAARFAAPGTAAGLLGSAVGPLALTCYVLLFLYGLRALDDQRRYQAAHLPRGGWEQFISQRSLLVLLLLGFSLGLGFVTLDAWFGPVTYSGSWYAFAVRGGLVFGLAVVGMQAHYAVAAGAARRPPVLSQAPVAAQPAPAAAEQLALPVAEEAPVPAEPTPELRAWRERLLLLMDQERPWLEPDLTLAELAQRLRIHPALLSRVLNTACGQNFHDFVNTYRTQEARRKLADPRLAHYSLLGIALESGFNSKSTFNRVFKKLTGQAPSEVARPNL